jgi:hypothetical protein
MTPFRSRLLVVWDAMARSWCAVLSINARLGQKWQPAFGFATGRFRICEWPVAASTWGWVLAPFRLSWSLSKSTRGPFGEGRRAVGMNLLPVSRPAFSARRKRRTVVRRFFILLRDDRLDIYCPYQAASVGHANRPYLATNILTLRWHSTRAIIGYRTGKRTTETTDDFIQDLRQRVIGVPEISTDGPHYYKNAIRDAFGKARHARRYPKDLPRNPPERNRSLCRTHEALRMTPAMALGIADHAWTVGELIDAALKAVPAKPTPIPAQRRRSFLVIQGDLFE